MLFFDQSIQILVPDDLFPVKSAHDGIPVSELIEVFSKDRGVQKTILAVDIDSIVLHRRSGKDQLVPCLVSQLMQRLALLRIVRLDSLTLIADDQVRVVLLKGFEDALSPGRFVVDHSHFHGFEWELLQVAQLPEPVCLVSQECSAGVLEICEFLKFFRPYRHDRGWGNDQNLVDFSHLIRGPCDGQRGQRLS